MKAYKSYEKELFIHKENGWHSKMMTVVLMIALFVFLLLQLNLIMKVDAETSGSTTEQVMGKDGVNNH